MKKTVCALALLLFFSVPALAAEKPADLKTDKAKLSYTMGRDLGNYFKGLHEDLDLKILQQGIEEGYTGKKSQLSPEETQAIQQQFAARQQQKEIEKTVAQVKKNRAAADKFLAANKKKEGVKVTKSGLQYKVIKQGTGATPTKDDTVKVHYEGKLLSGKVFDSSYQRKEPVQFKVGQVIPGWQEALQLMQVGGVYELAIPPDLAYGDRGAPPVIEPGSALLFKVELLDIPKEKK